MTNRFDLTFTVQAPPGRFEGDNGLQALAMGGWDQLDTFATIPFTASGTISEPA